MNKEEQDFINAINGTGQYAPKPKFLGTGKVGKQSAEAWRCNPKDKIVPGDYGKALAQWVKNERQNTLLVNREDIINELKKENRYNG